MDRSTRVAAVRGAVSGTWIGGTARRARRRLAIFRQTRQFHPDHIALAASGHVIFVDPHDRRGREIITGLGRGHQPALLALWRRAIAATAPSLVLDVGANYGEFVPNTRYPATARVLAIEANPRVVHHLRRSLAAHPDHAHLECHAVLAGDHGDGEATLAVDPGWSGSAGTSLDRTQDGGPLVHLAVAVRRIDALVASGRGVAPGPVVVKIDTEGSEAQVLAGMSHVLADASEVVGIVEFDPAHLRRRGTDPTSLFATLAQLGPCWAIDWEGSTVRATEAPVDAQDLIVVSNPVTASALGLLS